MTLRQIHGGSLLGIALMVLAVTGVIPRPFELLGLVIIIGSIVIGGADGTLPRMR